MHLSHQAIGSLLNLQYGVCFGVVFSHQFIAPSTQTPVTFYVPPDAILWAAGFALTVYFFLDWANMHVLRQRNADAGRYIGLVRVVLMSLWVWFLGAVVVLSVAEGKANLLLLGLYALTAGGYHLYNYRTAWYPVAGPVQILGGLVSATVVVLAFVLLFHWAVLMWHPDPGTPNLSLFLSITGILVLVKGLHLVFLALTDGVGLVK